MGRSFGGTRSRARLLITRLLPSNASSRIATLCILIGVISRCLESCKRDLSMTRRSGVCPLWMWTRKKAWFLPYCFHSLIYGNSVKGMIRWKRWLTEYSFVRIMNWNYRLHGCLRVNTEHWFKHRDYYNYNNLLSRGCSREYTRRG